MVRVLQDAGLGGVPVAVFPLGTGNDMARTLGAVAPDLHPESLDAWFHAARVAPSVPSDVFSVGFDTHLGGSIVCVRGGVETVLSEGSVTGTASCFVSVGLDARVVYAVELHRQRSALLNKLVYFLAGAATTLNVFGSAPLGSSLASVELDGVSLELEALPFPVRTLAALAIPSYASGSRPWAAAWSFPARVYAALYSGHAAGAAVPKCLMGGGGPPSPAPSSFIQRWVNACATLSAKASSRLRYALAVLVAGCGVAPLPPDPWRPPARDDGLLDVLAMRSLLQESGVAGPKTGAFGGVYRLAQAGTLRLVFRHPHGKEGDTPSRSQLVTSAVRRAARGLRARASPRTGVLAPPEPYYDDEEGGTGSEVEDLAVGRLADRGGRVDVEAGRAQHHRGKVVFTTATHPTRGHPSAATASSSGGSTGGTASVRSPPPAREGGGIDRGAPDGEPGARVKLGGVFADSAPSYLQVDGEAYKVFGLRTLEVAHRSRAMLVKMG